MEKKIDFGTAFIHNNDNKKTIHINTPFQKSKTIESPIISIALSYLKQNRKIVIALLFIVSQILIGMGFSLYCIYKLISYSL